MEREYIRDRTLEGHESARTRGKTIGGATVTDDAMLSHALHLRDQNLSLRDIATRLVITKGKKKEKIMRISVRSLTAIAAVAVALAGGVTTAAAIAAPARPATATPAAAATDRPDARPQLPAAPDLGTGEARDKRNALGTDVRAAGDETLNSNYRILDAVPGQASGKAGVAVTWLTPTGRDPYKEWDWIGIYKGDMPGYWSYGKYVDWNWACPQANCHDHGATVINTKLDTGQKYTIVYFTWKWTAVASFTYYRH